MDIADMIIMIVTDMTLIQITENMIIMIVTDMTLIIKDISIEF